MTAAHHGHAGHKAEGGARDPVCGMTVDPHGAKHRHPHEGMPYYFCSAGCLAKFKADPGKYLGAAESTPRAPVAESARVPEGTIYTCPMHPEIRQVGPGACPICGMALEPLLVSADAAPNEELIDMSRRFPDRLVLTIPVFALEMGGHLTGLNHYIGQQTSNWLQMLLATPVVCGPAGRSSCAAGIRSSRAISTCSR
jgi:Cu+-exporting ATPase